MAKYVHEVMSTELFRVRPEEPIGNAILGILSLDITAAAVVDAGGHPLGVVSLRDLLGERGADRVADRMTSPARTIHQDRTIREAATELARASLHRFVVVDDERHAVGMISALDVLRGELGLPVPHPEALPHRDRFGVTWTDPIELDMRDVGLAPDGRGVFVLLVGEAARPEVPVWAEIAPNVRTRLIEILNAPQSGPLGCLLARDRKHLRFRAASIAEPRLLAAALGRAQAEVASASGLPTPVAAARR